MMKVARQLLVAVALAAGLFAAPHARAAANYQGIYTILDPYAQGTLTSLQAAAQAGCAPGKQSAVSPFCTASNGIFFRIPWCDFQLYHLSNAQGQPYPSCHYWLEYSGGVGSAGIQVGFGDETSPCSGSYDTCAGSQRSLLGTVLQQVVKIDRARAGIGLPPLNLSIGLFAGSGTPQTLLDTVGYLDIPNNDSAHSPDTEQCMRLPLAWKPQFLSAYEQAFDTLIAYIQQQIPADANITIVKTSAIAAQDEEVQMPGLNSTVAVPADPGPAGPGPLLTCQSSAMSAQLWLNAYNQQPNYGQNFSQANEYAYGSVIGHEWATLQNAGITNAIVSIATTNGQAFADIDCGVSGAGSCAVMSASYGNWSQYYLELYTNDLFNGGLAYTAASSAYSAVRNGPFVLAPSQLATDSTALQPPPADGAQYPALDPSSQVPCILNNTDPADAPAITLNETPLTILGSGTVVSFQTHSESGGLCSVQTPTGTAFGDALSQGVSQGALFLEVESDAAITDLAQCSPYLTNALNAILATNPATASCAL